MIRMKTKCSICLEEISGRPLKKLSCGHDLHYDCYMKQVIRKHIFINCPLCRQLNTNINKFSNNSFEIIYNFIGNKTKNKMNRCICTTKSGKRCKNRSKVLNYGMCSIHNKNILNENLYSLMEKYIYLILSLKNCWLTKIYLIDIGKKIIIKYCNPSSGIDEIFLKYYEFYTINDDKTATTSIEDYKLLYQYYNLELPKEEWIKKCNKEYVYI